MLVRPVRRIALTSCAALAAGSLAIATTIAPAQAATIGVAPARTIAMGSNLPLQAIASNGTIYSLNGSNLDVWAPDSAGAKPHVLKTFTVSSATGQPQLNESAGRLAFAATSPAPSVVVMDPSQAAGPVVATRTITGALTQLDNPGAVAWAPNGSLWVYDNNSGTTGVPELLRFAPGADGNVAPVQIIAGSATRLSDGTVLNSAALLAGMPDNGVAYAPATVGDPTILIFGGGQSGNVAPAHRVVVPTPTPHWISEGLASDPAGHLYIGSGDVQGDSFGRLDIYSKTGAPVVTLGGPAQRFQTPLVPTVAKNGTLALSDGLLLDFGGSSTQAFTVKVFKPLFTKPGGVTGLTVTKGTTTQTVTWKAPTNPSGTPLSYIVTVKQGTKVLRTTRLTSTRLVLTPSTLPKGTLSVAVAATNIGGTGATITKTFTN